MKLIVALALSLIIVSIIWAMCAAKMVDEATDRRNGNDKGRPGNP